MDRSHRHRPPQGEDPRRDPLTGGSRAGTTRQREARPGRPRTSGGAVAVRGGAVYTFHLRESNPRSVANSRERRLAGGSL